MLLLFYFSLFYFIFVKILLKYKFFLWNCWIQYKILYCHCGIKGGSNPIAYDTLSVCT